MAAMVESVRRTVDVPEAAKIIGISRGACYAAVRRGNLRAIRVGRRWLIPIVELERLLAGNGSAGSAPDEAPQETDVSP